jgi:hypothetical protein
LSEYRTGASTLLIEPSAKTCNSDPSRQRSDNGTSSDKLGGGGAKASFGFCIRISIVVSDTLYSLINGDASLISCHAMLCF